jgi:hypothetical protein
MNKLLILVVLLISISCSQNINKKPNQDQVAQKQALKNQNIITESYELIIPKSQKGLLIIFPCFPCDAENTTAEFGIENLALENNIAVLMMNFNQHLWLSGNEKKELEAIIMGAISKYAINTDNTFIGGFSSGGNVSILLTDYLKSTGSVIQPKGLFVVDSPIDLLALYEVSQKTIEKNYSEVAIQEAQWIVSSFDDEFGTGDTSLVNYEHKSPYTSKTHSLNNVSHLKGVTTRFYSEPDTTWWRDNRQAEYEETNAFYIEQLVNDLRKLNGENSITYITTQNKGYRANGDRHPHSWSIVDKKGLINWMVEGQ